MKCTHCGSESTKKNGHTHYGKQNYYCHPCHRQFVEGGQDWFVSESEKTLIKKLLLERISLAGICRVVGVSEAWLGNYIVKVYADSPDDLNAVLELSDKDSYLAARFEEEIQRLHKKKSEKLIEAYTSVEDFSVIFEIEESDNELFTYNYATMGDYYEGLDMCLAEDLLSKEVYGKERGLRVQFIGFQLDEMWSFVGNKENKQWIWLALNPVNRQIVAFHIGGRSAIDAQLFYDKIPAIFKGMVGFFSDYWQAYVSTFQEEAHFGVGKDSGLTAYIERFNCTIRQMSSRLVRKALSFSKSLENHIGAIKYFICHYNLKMKALHI